MPQDGSFFPAFLVVGLKKKGQLGLIKLVGVP